VPLTVPVAIVAGLLPHKKRRTPEEVARYLRGFVEGTGGEWDWDDFESTPISNPALEEIRRQAILVGPPNSDLARLKELLSEVEGMTAQTSA
jgi:hypothetical protein